MTRPWISKEDAERLDESRKKAMDAASLAERLRSSDVGAAAQAYAEIYRADVLRAGTVLG